MNEVASCAALSCIRTVNYPVWSASVSVARVPVTQRRAQDEVASWRACNCHLKSELALMASFAHVHALYLPNVPVEEVGFSISDYALAASEINAHGLIDV